MSGDGAVCEQDSYQGMPISTQRRPDAHALLAASPKRGPDTIVVLRLHHHQNASGIRSAARLLCYNEVLPCG